MSSDEKTRIRSQRELEQQAESLSIVKDILVSHDLKPIISGGTLLGAVRDGDFIAWDWDAEFFLFYEQVRNKAHLLSDDLRAQGFTISKQAESEDGWKIVASTGDFDYELRAWHRDGKLYRRTGYKVPAHFFDRLCWINLRGQQYQAPYQVNEYLTYIYGADWQTPKRTADKNEYNSAEHFIGTDRKRNGGKVSLAQVIRKGLKNTRQFIQHLLS